MSTFLPSKLLPKRNPPSFLCFSPHPSNSIGAKHTYYKYLCFTDFSLGFQRDYCIAMIKALWYITMAWVIILNSMVYSVICVNYQLNKTFISEYFCENKDEPLSLCQGKCFLGKQLDNATEQENPLIDFRADFNVFTMVVAYEFFALPISLPNHLSGLYPPTGQYLVDLARTKKPPRG